MGDSEPEKSAKKRKRTLGSFPCPRCSKVFTRTDHLARHHLNHNPKQVFECEVLVGHFGGVKRKCGKQFVRRDLRDRHVKRHLEEEMDDGTESGQSASSELPSHKGIESGMVDSEQQILKNGCEQENGESVDMLLTEADAKPTHSRLQQKVSPLDFRALQKDAKIETQISAETTYCSSTDLIRQAVPPSAPVPTATHRLSHEYLTAPSLKPSLSQPVPTYMGGRPRIHPHTSYTDPSRRFPEPNQSSSWGEGQFFPPVPFNGFQKNSSIPALQNDIVSWLFTDGHPAAASRLEHRDFASSILPSPLGSLMSPSADVSHVGMMHTALDVDPYTSYGFLDSNVFPSGTNPLDEMFGQNQEQQLDSGVLRTLLVSDRSLQSRASSTGQSLPRSPTVVHDENVIHRLIQEHGSNNLPSHPHLHIDSNVVNRLAGCIDSITVADIQRVLQPTAVPFTIEQQLSYYLSVYWLIFHPQYPIMHRPSFNTGRCEPPLLWAMIVVGCNYCHEPVSFPGQKTPERKLSDLVIAPLRIVIFQHHDFKTPVRMWILQCLNLIEWSEKNSLLRSMHERGHIHHGTTVQLLRRLPVLGGNPEARTGSTGSGEESELDATDLYVDGDTDYELFVKWREAESLKRVTFMTFYLDIMDYVKFRHNPQIALFQVQLLNMPCGDEGLWDSQEVNGSFRKVLLRQRKLDDRKVKRESISNGDNFVRILKNVLRPSHQPIQVAQLSLFNQRLVLAGLASLMYQMQQTELQNNWSLFAAVQLGKHQWKLLLTQAFNRWLSLINGSCCKVGSKTTQLCTLAPSQCKHPLFHLTQIIGMGDINHYDIAIFGGSPANMSVQASIKDRQLVCNKLKRIWFTNGSAATDSDLVNIKGIVHCYILLWETMLEPVNYGFLDWSAKVDCFDGMFALCIATLVLWSYVYCLCGQESNRYDASLSTLRVYLELASISAEQGYAYLRRIRTEFDARLGDADTSSHLINITDKCCDVLRSVPVKNNISGLCFLVGTRLLHSQWDVIRENARLIIHCGLRSVGKPDARCLNLFADEITS